MRYEIKMVAVAGNNPLTGEFQPEQVEVVTVEAESIQKARNLAPVFMQMRVLGQLIRFYHNGQEI